VKLDFTVVGCLVERDGKFLVVKEGKEGRGGLYNLPGGHVDDLETLAEAAAREVKEESGYDVEVTGFLGVYQSIYTSKQLNISGAVFFAKVTAGEAVMSAAHPDVRWVTADELRQMTVAGQFWTKYPVLVLEDYLRRSALALEYVSSERY